MPRLRLPRCPRRPRLPLPGLPLISLARSHLAQGAAALIDLALPPVCRLCGEPAAEEADFCGTCHTGLTHSEAVMRGACRQCGFPLPRPHPQATLAATETPCAACQRSRLECDAVIPLWIYQDRVRDAVVAAKFAHRSPLGDALGRRLGGRVREVLSDAPPDLVTFVPSHMTRQVGRGGATGTQVIAEAVASVVGVRCRSLLKTTRRIAKQAWLDDQGRAENVRDAFTLKKGYAWAKPPEIASRHILLVEDVLTTGATANEVTGVLRAAGARRVTVAVVARAIRRG